MFPEMNLVSAFAVAAKRNRDKAAIFYGETEFSYGRLWSQTLWLGNHLQREFGVRDGNRIGLWLKNSPQFVPALFGALQSGGVAVPINSFLKPAEVSQIVRDAGLEVLLVDGTMKEALAELAATQPALKIFSVEDLPAAPEPATHPLVSRSESDLAILIYSSGTTGLPKGIMLSHGNLLHNVESCRVVLEAAGTDRIAVVLPMFHSFMLCVGVLLPLLVGGSIVLVKSLHPPKSIIQEIIHRQATILPSVPQFFRMMCHDSVPVQLPLRMCISGGAPLPGEILREFTQKFPIPLIEGYGLSEASPVVAFNPLHGPWKAGSIGVPVTNVEVSVQDDAGKILPPAVTGEICVRGGNVMLGYWNQPEETARAMRGDWLLTGDVGHRDAEGFFYITDRKKDMLLVNGINVYPREIEELIYEFPGIKEAAVVGQPDPRRGEQAVAFVSMNPGAALEEKDLLQFLRDKLADYKIPKRVHVLEKLPRNATGKIVKTELRKLRSDGSPSPIAVKDSEKTRAA
jgi:long-chain acyl-CoA synthetase